MYNHHLRSMAECLVRDGLVTEADLEKAQKSITSHWDDKIAVSWGTDDVIGLAKEHGKVVTEEQANDVLQTALHRHDAAIGISWDVLDCHIDGLGELPKCAEDDG